MMQISLILYTFYEPELRHALPVFIVFVVMVGLYGIAENIFLTLVTTLIVFAYHIFGIKAIPLETARDAVALFQRLSNVLFVDLRLFELLHLETIFSFKNLTSSGFSVFFEILKTTSLVIINKKSLFSFTS